MVMLILLAVVLGVSGQRLTIDKGLIDGLKAGDQGEVFYTVSINDSRREIEVGRCEVKRVEDFQAIVQVLKPAAVQPGYSIRFRPPFERISPLALLSIAQKRIEEGELDAGLTYLSRIRQTIPDDPLVDSLIREIEDRKQERVRQDQLGREEVARETREGEMKADLANAERAAAAEEHQAALVSLERVLKLAPDNQRALALKIHIEQAEQRLHSMLLIPGARFVIGVSRSEARYYNQQPQFPLTLTPFWIDRSPTGLVGYTYEEAERYCAERGNRLPTEFELEVSSGHPGFEPPSSAEWTASWYLPYPGNEVPEHEYGQKYRVIRGPDDFRIRTFLLPEERALDTSFRCACADRQPAGMDKAAK